MGSCRSYSTCFTNIARLRYTLQSSCCNGEQEQTHCSRCRKPCQPLFPSPQTGALKQTRTRSSGGRRLPCHGGVHTVFDCRRQSTYLPRRRFLLCGSEFFRKCAAFGADFDVGRDGLCAVGGQFTVEKSHDLFRSEGMRSGAHALSPFCVMSCAAGCGAPFVEGSRKSRNAVRARKRRDRTVLRGNSRRRRISRSMGSSFSTARRTHKADSVVSRLAGSGTDALWPKNVARKAALRRWARRILKPMA